MKTVTNEKLIRRNGKIAQYANIGGLVVLFAGLYITFKYPDKFAYAMGALLIGFFLSQIGMYYGNRWARSPRPDQIIDKSMKGLGREYTIYHYVTPVPHLLVGPAGVWTIMPYYQTGVLTYEKKRWRLKGGGFVQGYLRIFGQDNVGRPDLESDAEIDTVRRYFKKVLPEGTEVPEIKTALLFANPKIELKTEDAPLPTMTPKDLKDFFRVTGKEKPIGDLMLDTLRRALPQPDREE